MNIDDRWALESWGWTVLSSYSWAVLEREQEQRIAVAVEAPRMSRRSLRLHTTTGHYGDDDPLDRHSVSYCPGGSREDRPLKSRRSHRPPSGVQSLLLTPQKSQSGSGSAPLNSSLHSGAPSDASLLSSLLDQSCIQERTLMDSFWGLDAEGDNLDRTILASGDVLTAQTQTSVVNGYTCRDCSFQESGSTHTSSQHHAHSSKHPAHSSQHHAHLSKHPASSSKPPAPSSSTTHHHTASTAAAPHSTTVYSRDKARKHRPADWRYCANMNGEGHAEQDGQGDAGASLSKGSSSVWLRLLTLMSLLRDFLVLRCLPYLYKLLLLLIPLLLLMVLCYWGPSTLWAVLPAVNITDWRTSSLLGSAHWDTPLEQASTAHYAPPPAPADPQPSSPAHVDPERSVRVERLERSLAQLWERVARGEQRQQEQSEELQALYRPLQERLETGAGQLGSELKQWAEGMVQERLQPLKEEVERKAENVTQQQQRLVYQQQSYQTRMAELEALLEALAKKTEEVQRAQETIPTPVSASVDHTSHEALLLEVQRLEAALGSIRADLQGIMGCQGSCKRLDNIPSMVSAQVKAELQALFYGSDGVPEVQGGVVPDSLLPWLSARFVNGSDLRASLAELEQSILGNVSVLMAQGEQRQRSRQSITAQSLRASVGQATSDSGLSEEHVELIVKNALRLYSQDRTGMVDYALESGGGSIISTRCSETFETQTALMSLFGIPLWYFTQSPRVVIQPDVQPGNCWAFRGSHGYLIVRLSMRVLPTAFSLEHIPRALSPSGQINSAPRDYAVYGLEDEQQEEGKLLGRYMYEEDGEALQTYPVTEQNDQVFQIIELRVLSNWGNPDYTCLYRFRVHGQPASH
ncbi:hypothetical protein ACEWY4_025920 [Coilia grayii]|uniref:SUN domain-containing protein n=1 Tax=Coilia grayii TaxID=363190 RepID=A0ABD1IVG0_9TELE